MTYITVAGTFFYTENINSGKWLEGMKWFAGSLYIGPCWRKTGLEKRKNNLLLRCE